jgi:hypothetical protein
MDKVQKHNSFNPNILLSTLFSDILNLYSSLSMGDHVSHLYKTTGKIIRVPPVFMDSPYYSDSELCGGVVTVSFSKYLPWQAMHFLQRSTHFSKLCCREFATSSRRIVEQAVLTFHVRFSVSKALPPLENRSSSRCIVSIGLMDVL